ncbi:TraB/GumN family protein [Altererythrobacter sp. CAU 1778]
MKTILNRITRTLAGLGIVLSAPAVAQEQKLPQPQPVEAVEADTLELGPALWKVADEDTTIYLFGTVHVLPESRSGWMNGPIAKALEESETLVTEVDTTQATAMAPTMIAAATLAEGQNLREMLSESDREAYEGVVTDLGLPVATFDKFEPWFAAMNLSMLTLVKGGYNPELGAEAVLSGAAGEAKTRGELETIQYQIDLFDGLELDDQIAYLNQVVDAVPMTGDMIDQMVTEWLEGDADALAEMMNASMDNPMLYERLLVQRNANWARWIDDRMDQPGTVFVAVGAGHLAGEGSVQDKLGELGIEVTRLQ